MTPQEFVDKWAKSGSFDSAAMADEWHRDFYALAAGEGWFTKGTDLSPGNEAPRKYGSLAIKCPACDGWGKRGAPDPYASSAAERMVLCAACGGSGIVWGDDGRR